MPFKFLVAIFFIFSFLSITAQKEMPFGTLTSEEKDFTTYDQDSTANAVVLYEKGNNFFKIIEHRMYLVKEYHVKIKILNDKGFNEANISLPYYYSEKIEEINAVTHNGDNQHYVSNTEIFTKNVNQGISVKRFAFPNIKKGSIIEYRYHLISPRLYKLNGWKFQSNLPKLYSEFNAKIPANYRYNRELVGGLKLTKNEASIDENCIGIGWGKPTDCEVLKYAMEDIPPFKIDKTYMLAASNYISRLDFELASFQSLDGSRYNYTQSWKDVDREFMKNRDIGKQLTKTNFFENNVPKKLLSEGDPLTKATKIYKFVQEHFTWDGYYSSYGKAEVKKAFRAKMGNTWEINMSLINLLNAAGIKTNLMLTSTRNNGLPKKTHPVITDFNYAIAKTVIDGKDYLLDASDKYTPFGTLPYKVLNHYGRVMDFKNDSYWFAIKPKADNKYEIRANVRFNLENKNALGVFDIISTGYPAMTTNKKIDENTELQYLEQMERSIGGAFEITQYKKDEKLSDEHMVAERFTYEIENILGEEIVYFNPFFIQFFEENPFLNEERNYPIDFGYPITYKYLINITLPEGYQVYELPEKVAIALGESRAATFQFDHQQTTTSISFSLDLSINNSYFEATDYTFLKDLFTQLTNIQKNALVVLKKE
ncbi:DUF3857 domain-containing protein [Maribacter sp.]|nr:DUF3857 domain-containing protein [Maribacter sp.]